MTPARSPGRHLAPARGAGSASPHRGSPPRSVLGLLAAGLLLALSLVVVVAPAALAEEEDGAVSDSSTDTGATDGVDDGVDDVGLANDDSGVMEGADHMGTGGSPPSGESPSPADSGGWPSWAGGPQPTQHEVTPPGPASIPTALPGPPSLTMPGVDMLPGLMCCPTSGPGGNTGSFGHHESDE
jgi:hypothetical protein